MQTNSKLIELMDTGDRPVQPPPPLSGLKAALDNSWVRKLSPETETNLRLSRKKCHLPDDDDNRSKRPVFNGHYVLVKPTGLKNPKLLLYSRDVAHEMLQLSQHEVESQEFLDFVSGRSVLEETWATPYALSIMGQSYLNNCPFGTGDGYGDGRAISIGEAHGWEMQLKGAGKTPFHRGADGRAVLRSSIREFLASEAMHWLGVPTTRALSLVLSENGDRVHRPWYSDDLIMRMPSLDDPRLAAFPLGQRRAMIRMLREQKIDPDMMIFESCAITCRVSPSFTRIGHLDHFSRRARKKSLIVVRPIADYKHNDNSSDHPENDDSSEEEKQPVQHENDQNETNGSELTTTGKPESKPRVRYDRKTLEWLELEAIIWHACYREFREEAHDPFFPTNDIVGAATVLLSKASEKIASMVAHWLRVGFTQGNFNADNCLIGGRTMDYGPFGWMEEFNPVFAKWTGSGEHYGFLNQPAAGFANFHTLVRSVVPVIVHSSLDDTKDAKEGPDTEAICASQADFFMEQARARFEKEVDETFRLKLGLQKDEDVGDELWESLVSLLRKSRTDWTLFWRQLMHVAQEYPDRESTDYTGMMSILMGENHDSNMTGTAEPSLQQSCPFYEQLADDQREDWISWIEQWRIALCGSETKDSAQSMKMINPKFVLREWMLVEAYTAAGKGDYATLNELYDLIQQPYSEGTPEQCQKYYRRAPERALATGGTAFMS